MDKQILEILTQMQSDIKNIKTTQDEHGQILRALDERTQVLSASTENANHEIAEMKGELKGLRKDLNLVELATASNWADIARLKAK